MEDKPKYVWGAIINMGGGLHWTVPKRFRLHDSLQTWWCNDNEIKQLGFYYRPGYSTFASINKHEVELFVLGARTVSKFINNWSKNGSNFRE